MADYNNRAYESILERIASQAEVFYSGENFNLDSDSLTGVIVNAVADLYDQNSYYLDRRSEASYLSRAVLEQDIRTIVANLGYTPSFKTGATVDVEFTTSGNVTIPKGSQIKNSDSVVFSTLSQLSLLGGVPDSVQCVHGVYQQKVYSAKGDSSEKIEFKRSDVLEGQLTVKRNGVAFTDYTFEFNELDQNVLVLNNLNLGDVISIDFYYGGGVTGNKVAGGTSSESGVLNELVSSFDNSDLITNIENADKPSGGAEPPSAEEIREQAPNYIDSQSVILTETTPAGALQKDSSTAFVQDAFVIKDFDDGAGGTGKPTANLVAFASGETVEPLTASQTQAVSDFLKAKGAIDTEWTVANAKDAPVVLEMDVYLSNKSEETIKKQEILTYLLDSTSGVQRPSLARFANDIKIDTFKGIVGEISGVEKVEVKKLTKSPQSSFVTKGTDRLLSANVHSGQDENAIYAMEEKTPGSLDVDYMIPFTPTRVGPDYIEDATIDPVIHSELHDDTSGFDSSSPDLHGPRFYRPGGAGNPFWFPENTSFHSSLNIEPHYIFKVAFDDTSLLSNQHQEGFYLAKQAASESAQKFECIHLHGWDLAGDSNPLTLEDAKNVNIEFTLMRNLGVFVSGETTCESVYNDKTDSSIQATYQDGSRLYFDSADAPNEKFRTGTRYNMILRAESIVLGGPDKYYESLNGGLTAFWTNALSAADRVHIYVTPYAADVSFKHEQEVLTLSASNIKMNFR